MYSVYLLRCADGTFYAGVTTDMKRRLVEHNESPKGAKYTKGRRPVSLAYEETCESRSAAQRREYELRTTSRTEKLRLIKAWEKLSART